MPKITETILPSVKILEPQFFADERGSFFENFRQNVYSELGISLPFVQDNISRSLAGTLRGLHYQLKFPQGKLITVVRGRIFDVVLDVRCGSPTFGRWISVILDDVNHKQIYIPPGCAHGFCVLSEVADLYYKCTEYYHSGDEYGILWSDPELSIAWPLTGEPVLSDKDTKHRVLADIPLEALPKL